MKCFLFLSFVLLAACATPQINSIPADQEKSAAKTAGKTFDAQLTQVVYPFPVKTFDFYSQLQKLQMAYMDIHPENKKVIVLLHGKNFSGNYFEQMANALVAQGYRVIIPDQIGFGKSTKPQNFQFSVHGLAQYTLNLLANLQVKKFTLLGHSMGGMIATRMALMQPEGISKLILEDPLGLEDWRLLTPYKSVDELYTMELKNTPEKMRAYQLENYYDGQWKPEYDRWLEIPIGWAEGPDRALIAMDSALTTEMVYTQPVYYEFKNLKMPVVLFVGEKDRTAIGKAWAPAAAKSKMGNYPVLGREVVKLIPHGKLVELKGLGHAPHIQDFDTWMAELLRVL